MNELKAMRTFARVADAGSFVAASRTLNVAPAVVTRAIAELEEHLGARLMTRTTRRTALTDVGMRYLERVLLILAAVDDATALARETREQPGGSLRVRAPSLFAAHQLAFRLQRFHEAHPQVAVELSACGPVETLDPDHDITIVVSAGTLDGDFVARPLGSAELIACASPAYLDRHGRPQQPGELAHHRLLAPAPRGLRLVRGNGRPQGGPVLVVPARAALTSPGPELQQASALAGQGIAVLPSFAVDAALRDGRLERVLPDWHLGELSIWACLPTRRHVAASTRAFLDFLIDEFGDAPASPTARVAAPRLRLAA